MTIKKLFNEWKRQAKELGVWNTEVETGVGVETLSLYPMEGKYEETRITFVFDDHDRCYDNELVIRTEETNR